MICELIWTVLEDRYDTPVRYVEVGYNIQCLLQYSSSQHNKLCSTKFSENSSTAKHCHEEVAQVSQHQQRRQKRCCFTSLPIKMSGVCMFLMLTLVFTIDRGLCRAPDTAEQRNTLISDLVGDGCTLCYDADYGSETKSSDIASCFGPYLVVGTQTHDASVLEINAVASAELVKSDGSSNNFLLSCGLYWHLSEGVSSGLTAEQRDSSATADVGKYNLSSSKSNDDRQLSWRLDQNDGRIPCQQRANLTKWRKNIYNCPRWSCE